MNKTTENRLGGELRSHQAARRLLEELRRGHYADAAQLPSELELADVLGVSRTVVRDALSDLERDGYLERVRGIGTLVNRDVVQLKNRMDQKLEFYKYGSFDQDGRFRPDEEQLVKAFAAFR